MEITFQDILEFNENFVQNHRGDDYIIVYRTPFLEKKLIENDFFGGALYIKKNIIFYIELNRRIWWSEDNGYVEKHGNIVYDCIFTCKTCGKEQRTINALGKIIEYCPKCLR